MRPPNFVIGRPEDPYLLRWFLVPRNRFLNVYLHKFLRDDDDRALHDHPWWFVSVVLKGTYREVTRDADRCPACGNDFWKDGGAARRHGFDDCPNCSEPLRIVSSWRRWLSVVVRRPTYRHRVELLRDRRGRPISCWTLVFTGPRVREWGFWCPKGFVNWKEFTKPGNHGEVGRGCE